MTEPRRRASRPAGARAPEPRPPGALDRVAARLRGLTISEGLLAIDGLAVSLAGVVALFGSIGANQGEWLLLVVGGLGLVIFGVMIAFRRNLAVARTGLIGMTAGYFASALSEFEVATDPCDIGAVLERCATDVVKGAPWIVYQGPLILAVLAFFVIVLEPQVTSRKP